MIEILTVCTGNICRSPLAEALLRARLAPLEVRVSSAGVAAVVGSPMTDETLRLAMQYGVGHEEAAAHRARRLVASQLDAPDLILAMDRTHRRSIVEMAPRRVRSTFTIREFARLAREATDAEIRAAATTDAAAASGPADPRDAVRRALAHVAARRGVLEPPTDAADDDVPDPYRRSWEVYERSGGLLEGAVDEVVRVIRLALA